MKLVYGLLLGMLCSVVATDADAQLITWEPSVQLFQGDAADESFISTNGTLVEAINGGGDDIAVNGVDFDGVLTGSPEFGTEVLTRTSTGGAFTINNSNINLNAFQQGEFAGTNVGTLIESGLWAVDSVTLNNLVVGNDYEIQLISNDARGNRTVNFIGGLGDGSGTGPVGMLQLNNSPLNDPVDNSQVAPVFPETNVGDFIIGTFTADATTLTFESFGTNSGGTLNLGDSRSQVNAIQLRDVTVVDMALKGDVDLSGVVDFLDIAPFIAVLGSGGFQAEADVTCDEVVDFLDVAPFIALLAGP